MVVYFIDVNDMNIKYYKGMDYMPKGLLCSCNNS